MKTFSARKTNSKCFSFVFLFDVARQGKTACSIFAVRNKIGRFDELRRETRSHRVNVTPSMTRSRLRQANEFTDWSNVSSNEKSPNRFASAESRRGTSNRTTRRREMLIQHRKWKEIVNTKTKGLTGLSILRWTLIQHVTRSLKSIDDADLRRKMLTEEMIWLNRFWGQPVPRKEISAKYWKRLIEVDSFNVRRDLYE